MVDALELVHVLVAILMVAVDSTISTFDSALPGRQSRGGPGRTIGRASPRDATRPDSGSRSFQLAAQVSPGQLSASCRWSGGCL